ncbi:MAG: sugar phosphate isomerase/epimerase [Candidatus Latescibacteria bacterium]|nr:sugar phosphate isomerase/epimerase [Candidatus Latescibacterota bacterium]
MPTGLCAYTFSHLGGFMGTAGYDAFALIDLAARHGLAGVEFPPEHCLPDLREETLQRARQSAAERSLFIVADGGPVKPDMLRRLIPVAHGLGTPTLRVILSGILGGDRRPMAGRWPEHLRTCLGYLRDALPIAKEHGITIAVENHSDATSHDLLWLCDELNSDQVGINLDTGNVLAVCEEPVEYVTRLMPFIKNVHLKDYTLHPTPEGYRMARCALGRGAVDFPALLALFDQHHPSLTKTIELGALEARHVRLLADDYWAEFPVRPITDMLPHLRLYWQKARPAAEDWRTPWERKESPEALAAYETREFEESVAYLRRIGAV